MTTRLRPCIGLFLDEDAGAHLVCDDCGERVRSNEVHDCAGAAGPSELELAAARFLAAWPSNRNLSPETQALAEALWEGAGEKEYAGPCPRCEHDDGAQRVGPVVRCGNCGWVWEDT